uniref:Ovule protein n=1 Tax=Mesocestoides corti TaxID=53468 RepID=A0A5K3FXK1_MESCO
PRTRIKIIGATKRVLLTNHKPESHVRLLPSESSTLAAPLNIYCFSFVSISDWLLVLLACYWNAERQRII